MVVTGTQTTAGVSNASTMRPCCCCPTQPTVKPEPTWVRLSVSRHVAGAMRVHVLLLRVLVLLLALLCGPLVAVGQLGQVLLGTRLHIAVGEVVILQGHKQGQCTHNKYTHADTA